MKQRTQLESLKVFEYRKHIAALSDKLGCEVRIVDNNMSPELIGMMYVEFGYVEGPVIRSQVDYFIHLHELGHFYHGHTQGRPPKESEKFYFENGVLRSEAQAWEWALDNTIEEPTQTTRSWMWNSSLKSYYDHAERVGFGVPGQRIWHGNRHYVAFAYDKPDDYFFNVAKRILNEI